MARKVCLLVIVRVCANANSWHSHKSNSNFALGIAVQGYLLAMMNKLF